MSTEGNKASTKNLFPNLRGKRLLFICLLAIVTLVVILIAVFSGSTSSRTESYKKITGGAGLEATIEYGCKKNCFNFNVYILNDSGQQVAVVRPNKDGKVNAALPEGNYIMLIGKRIDKDGLFPQEPVVLKNGQQLDVNLQYRGK